MLRIHHPEADALNLIGWWNAMAIQSTKVYLIIQPRVQGFNLDEAGQDIISRTCNSYFIPMVFAGVAFEHVMPNMYCLFSCFWGDAIATNIVTL